MPTKGRSQISSYPTPLIGDVVFYEVKDLSKEKSTGTNYGDPHPDSGRWPNHNLVSIQSLSAQGDQVYVLFYAADRKHEDLYNFEHTQANLGGHKFSTVTRSYVVRRDAYDPASPALGSVMADQPAGKFSASDFHLISRSQDRISARSARAEASIGQAELDSLYVVETRVYIDREEIVENTYDISVNGNLYTRSNIFIRGDDYDSTQNIEDAVNKDTLWGPTSGGQLETFKQVSDDVWLVTTQDLIPQSNLPLDTPLFGGTVLRVYESSNVYAWPAVLGSDGVVEDTGNAPFEVMDWVLKDGGTRNFPRPRYKRNAKRVKTRSEIHSEWLTQAEMDTAEAAGSGAGGLDIIDELEPRSWYYPSPILNLNIPPALHGGGYVQSDTGTEDPTWGLNASSTRTYPATNHTDWPASVVADVDVQLFRGGYLVTRLKIYNPNNS